MNISRAIRLAQEINTKYGDVLQASPHQHRIPLGFVTIKHKDNEHDVYNLEAWRKFAQEIGIVEAQPQPAISNHIPEVF